MLGIVSLTLVDACDTCDRTKRLLRSECDKVACSAPLLADDRAPCERSLMSQSLDVHSSGRIAACRRMRSLQRTENTKKENY